MVIDTTICEELIEVAILGAGHGILTEALGICKDLQELRPNASMYSFSECYCYYLCDKYQEAAEIYETKFKPHFPEYDFGEAILCSCWWMTDNITKAKNIFNQLEQKEQNKTLSLEASGLLATIRKKYNGISDSNWYGSAI